MSAPEPFVPGADPVLDDLVVAAGYRTSPLLELAPQLLDSLRQLGYRISKDEDLHLKDSFPVGAGESLDGGVHEVRAASAEDGLDLGLSGLGAGDVFHDRSPFVSSGVAAPAAGEVASSSDALIMQGASDSGTAPSSVPVPMPLSAGNPHSDPVLTAADRAVAVDLCGTLMAAVRMQRPTSLPDYLVRAWLTVRERVLEVDARAREGWPSDTAGGPAGVQTSATN